MLALTIAILAGVGLLIAAYFTAVFYGVVEPDARWIPPVCRMGDRTCNAVIFDPAGSLFGLPNSLLGIVWYTSLLVGVATGWVPDPAGPGSPISLAYLAGSVVTVVVGAYLAYVLLRVLRVPCPLCFTSHGINLAIMLALLLG